MDEPRKPDYVCAVDCHHFEELAEYFEYAGGPQPRTSPNNFRIYLEGKGRLRKGKSVDSDGREAGILLEETDDLIKFTKTYKSTEAALGARRIWSYEGVKARNIVAGINPTKESDLVAGIVKGISSARTFIMVKLDP